MSMATAYYETNKKSMAVTYVLSLFFFHYAYLGRFWMTALFWLVFLATAGIGSLVWWVVDLFRIPGMVDRYNEWKRLEGEYRYGD